MIQILGLLLRQLAAAAHDAAHLLQRDGKRLRKGALRDAERAVERPLHAPDHDEQREKARHEPLPVGAQLHARHEQRAREQVDPVVAQERHGQPQHGQMHHALPAKQVAAAGARRVEEEEHEQQHGRAEGHILPHGDGVHAVQRVHAEPEHKQPHHGPRQAAAAHPGKAVAEGGGHAQKLEQREERDAGVHIAEEIPQREEHGHHELIDDGLLVRDGRDAGGAHVAREGIARRSGRGRTRNSKRDSTR